VSSRIWLERASRDNACILPDWPISVLPRPAARTEDYKIDIKKYVKTLNATIRLKNIQRNQHKCPRYYS
jgi:hypothetical protein